MRKNKMLRLASVLLVLTLLSTSIIGGTFAKYVTSDSGTDTARVAKWGVEVISTSTAFAREYVKDDETVSAIANSVVTATGDGADNQKLVAPGTSGNLLAASIRGTTEVAVKVKTEAHLELTGWTINLGTTEETYCPIVITVDGQEYKMGAAEDEANHVYNTIEKFENAVETALNKNDAVSDNQFAPNANLGTAYDHNVTWAWEFDGTTDGAYQTDAKDTALGKLSNAPTIDFTYTATVTQIN